MWFRNLLQFWTRWKTKKNERLGIKPATPASRWKRTLPNAEQHA